VAGANGNANRLAALRNREAALKQAIAEEQVRLQKRREKDRARLALIVGEALLGEAARVPDFALLLKQTLKKNVTDDKTARFVEQMGWLS
jgi:uncharacterized membrane protein